MTDLMVFLRLALYALAITWSAAASSHRLDQYLQATTIALARDRLTIELRLTPGATFAPLLLAQIGVGAAGIIPADRQALYAQRVTHDLALTVDGHPVPLRRVSVSFPDVAAMRHGLGDISIEFEANLPEEGGTHSLTFVNSHLPQSGVYLVNCLVPEDPRVHILSQVRSIDQSRFEIAFAGPERVASGSATNVGYVVRTFLYQGIGHILTGYDHLLFACALVLAATTLWDLFRVVTAFTVAHSLTLVLATLDWIHLSAQIVEPVIGISIVAVAVQNLFWPAAARSAGRLWVAFCFGLFHGLGFAGDLLVLMHRMPHATALLALAGFSIGVEIGHQLILLPLFGLLAELRRAQLRGVMRADVVPRVRQVGSAAIAAAGLWYVATAVATVR